MTNCLKHNELVGKNFNTICYLKYDNVLYLLASYVRKKVMLEMKHLAEVRLIHSYLNYATKASINVWRTRKEENYQ